MFIGGRRRAAHGAMGQAISAVPHGGQAGTCAGPALAAAGRRGSIGWGRPIHQRMSDTSHDAGPVNERRLRILAPFSKAAVCGNARVSVTAPDLGGPGSFNGSS